MRLTGRSQIAALLATMALSVSAWVPAVAQDNPGVTDTEITLGSWSALSGPLAVYGVPGVAGQSAYYGMLNDAGGINDRTINVIVEDHAYNPQKAVSAARKLVSSDNVLAIQGAYGTGPSAAAFPYLQQANVPYIMPYGGAVDWYRPPQPGILGAQVLFDDQARALGRWAAKDGFKNIVVVHAALAAFEKVAANVEPGVKSAAPDAIVEMMPVKFGTTDYAPIALEIADKKPDAIVFIGTIQELSQLAKEVKQQNIDTQLFSYAGSVTKDIIELGGEAVEGLRGVSYTYPVESDAPAVAEYRKMLAKYAPDEKPDYGSLLTYALAKITAEAIRNAGDDLTRESLMDGFYALKDYDTGITAPVSFSPDHPLGTNSVLRVEIKDGKWEAVGDFVDSTADW